MVEHFRDGERNLPRELAETDKIEKALVQLGHLRQSLLKLNSPHSELAQKLCLAQLVLLIEDQHPVKRTTSGEPYSAVDEAIGVLLDAVKELRSSRSKEIADVISRIDPEKA